MLMCVCCNTSVFCMMCVRKLCMCVVWGFVCVHVGVYMCVSVVVCGVVICWVHMTLCCTYVWMICVVWICVYELLYISCVACVVVCVKWYVSKLLCVVVCCYGWMYAHMYVLLYIFSIYICMLICGCMWVWVSSVMSVCVHVIWVLHLYEYLHV